ncbi:hypothetical protein GCK32_020676, partial [Trichostrongylus colubriformis]
QNRSKLLVLLRKTWRSIHLLSAPMLIATVLMFPDGLSVRTRRVMINGSWSAGVVLNYHRCSHRSKTARSSFVRVICLLPDAL